MMQRNLDKDDIRDASDLLTHIDGWEKTGSYDEKAIVALDRWHAKRERIHHIGSLCRRPKRRFNG